MDFLSVLQQIEQEVTPLFGKGQVAQYIPALANVNPKQFAMGVTLTSGEFYGVGCVDTPFSIQSISKVFSYTLALKHYRHKLFERVWREPSGDPFNSLVQLEYESGIPRNPFINAGAIVVADCLLSFFGNQQSSVKEILNFVHQVSAQEAITYDPLVLESELASGHRNLALANLMKDFGNLQNPVEQVLNAYFQQCSIVMSTRELSRSMLYLANQGLDPVSGQEFLSESQAKRINSLMLTCGHYDASGDFAFRVGLPGKSGVGGGIVAIVPGKMAICVYSPELNEHGNSLIGTQALELFTTKTGLSIF